MRVLFLLNQIKVSEILTKTNLLSKIKAKADCCVRCGLCLPHCPTYNLKNDERYSPRGRIIMLLSWAEGKIKLSQADEYLSSCLICLNCEKVCPAEVDYASLIQNFHKQKNKSFKNNKQQIMINFFTNRWSNWLLLVFGKIAKFFHLAKLAHFLKPSFLKTALISTELIEPRFFNQFNQNKALSTNQPTQFKTIYLASLCTSSLFEQQMLKKTEQIFTKLGFKIKKLNNLGCCGSLDYHQGNLHKAKVKLINFEQQIKAQAKSTTQSDTLVLVNSSGCLSYLVSDRLNSSKAEIGQDKIKYLDSMSYLSSLVKEKKIKFKPWQSGKVILHLPCTQRYPLNPKKIIDLLNEIKNLNLAVVDWGCCGFAGSYIFTKAQESHQLIEQFITQIEKKLKLNFNEVEYLLTTNTGCKLQLNQQLYQKFIKQTKRSKANRSLKIIHPIEFLADLII